MFCILVDVPREKITVVECLHSDAFDIDSFWIDIGIKISLCEAVCHPVSWIVTDLIFEDFREVPSSSAFFIKDKTSILTLPMLGIKD